MSVIPSTRSAFELTDPRVTSDRARATALRVDSFNGLFKVSLLLGENEKPTGSPAPHLSLGVPLRLRARPQDDDEEPALA
jgi:hypothetical protein